MQGRWLRARHSLAGLTARVVAAMLRPRVRHRHPSPVASGITHVPSLFDPCCAAAVADLAATTGALAMQAQDLQKLVSVRMPYGRYRGRLIADLPGAYLAWFARTGYPAGELGRLLALMLELDHNGLASLLDPLRKR